MIEDFWSDDDAMFLGAVCDRCGAIRMDSEPPELPFTRVLTMSLENGWVERRCDRYRPQLPWPIIPIEMELLCPRCAAEPGEEQECPTI